MDEVMLEVKDLRVRYGAFEAVKGVGFTLHKGEILGIVGESGSGKSTIARTLIGLQKASGGTVLLGQGAQSTRGDANPQSKTSQHKTASASSQTMQMIFQDAVGSLNPRMTIRQTLEEVLKIHSHSSAECTPNTQTPKPPKPQTPSSLLSLVGLSPAVLDQYPREMSGGQCQRVSIARALACRPDILIADEPVSALDVSVQARILNLLRELRGKLGLTILLIAHDLAVVKNVCDRICVMEKGVFVDCGPSEQVFTSPTSAYTKRLLEAVPDVTRALRAR